MPLPSPPPSHSHRQRWRGWALGAVAVAAVLGVFALYLQPDFMVMLADQMWACF